MTSQFRQVRNSGGRCPRCGSVLLTNGFSFWGSFIGDRFIPACGYGIDEPVQASINVAELAAAWPDMEGIPEGEDVFSEYPISGLPDNETLSALVAEAYIEEEE